MYSMCVADKFKASAWHLALRAAFLGAVIGLSFVPGLNLLAALLIVVGANVLVQLFMIWVPPLRRRRMPGWGGRPGGPGGPSGDRFPRNPMPSPSALSVELEDPTATGLI